MRRRRRREAVTCKDLNPPCSRNKTPAVSRGARHKEREDESREEGREGWGEVKGSNNRLG